jgi:hypothetical protein
MTNVTNLPTATAPRAVAVDFSDPVAVYLDSDIFGQLQRVAKLMSSASLAPAHLRGEGKLGDCFLVAAQAFRWRMDPFAVAQHTYVLSGKLGYEGKLIAAVVNASGKLQGSLDYQYSGAGDQRQVTVLGKLIGDVAPRAVVGTVGGWKTSNEQWKKNTDQMLAYRGAREWARRYMPEAVLGIHADDDLAAPSSVTMRDITPPPSTPLAAVSAAMDALLDNVEQEADNIAPAASDAEPSPSAASSPEAPTGATLTPELAERARAIVAAIRKAASVKDIDKIMLAQRGNLDDISAASPEAHERIMEESRRRVADLAG